MTQISRAEIISCKIFSELEKFSQSEIPDLMYSDGTPLKTIKDMFSDDCKECNLCMEERPLIGKRFMWSVKDDFNVYLPLKICRSCYVESLKRNTIRLRGEFSVKIREDGTHIEVVEVVEAIETADK